jgi:L-asparaginase
VKSKVVILGMGGTISSIFSDTGLTPGKTTNDLLALIPEVVEKYDLETIEVMNIDSSNLQPRDWMILTEKIYEQTLRNDIKGIVVIHGTDQLVYSSSMTAFTIQAGIPIVFTGAQIPLTIIGSDGRKNLIDSIRVAAESDIGETVIVFNSKILRAVRTVKLREYDLDAFECVDPVYIGDIAYDIHIYDQSVLNRRNIISQYTKNVTANVALLKIFPGMKPEMLKILPSLGYDGIVLEAFGAGNVPTMVNSLISVIEDITLQNLPVIITSQCIFGTTELIYQTGRLAHKAGAISGYDLTAEAAITKLMVGLSKSKDINQITTFMHTNLVGELNPDINKITS